MSKEIFPDLDRDVTRLLLAGSASVHIDEKLPARRDALTRWGEKLPALAKLSQQIAIAIDAENERAAAVELLNLSTLGAQLRGAQAQYFSSPGELKDLPAQLPVDTPLLNYQIEPIHKALTKRGEGRVDFINKIVEQGITSDLRLLKAWVDAIADANRYFAITVAETAIPLLGAPVAGLIQEKFNIKGGEIDARRLACLARILGAKIKHQVLDAIENGSVAVRVAAIISLAQIDLAAALPIAKKLFFQDSSFEIRTIAAWALARSSEDEDLDLLINAFADENTRVYVAGALHEAAHPELSPRLQELLTANVLKKELDYASLIISILGTRKDSRSLPVLVNLWQSIKNENLLLAVGYAISNFDDLAALRMLAENVKHKKTNIRELGRAAAFKISRLSGKIES